MRASDKKKPKFRNPEYLNNYIDPAPIWREEIYSTLFLLFYCRYFIKCVVKPLASVMGIKDMSIEFTQVIENGTNTCINMK